MWQQNTGNCSQNYIQLNYCQQQNSQQLPQQLTQQQLAQQQEIERQHQYQQMTTGMNQLAIAPGSSQMYEHYPTQRPLVYNSQTNNTSDNFFRAGKRGRGVVKHALLKYYLDAYLPIMAQQGNWINKIIYIDGFAGPGYHENGDKGSPIIAYETAVNHIFEDKFQVEILLIFIESDKDYYENLKINMEYAINAKSCDKVSWRFIHGMFAEQIPNIMETYGYIRNNAILVFVDPFGFNGVPMKVLQTLVQRYLTEVFINVMYGYANRCFIYGNNETQQQLRAWLGMNESDWKSIVFHDDNKIPTSRMNSFFDLYIKQLTSNAHSKRYHLKFSIKNIKNRNIYSLIFITGHKKGYRIMKQAMWNNSQVIDDFVFSEFSQDEEDTLKNRMTKTEIAQAAFGQILSKYSGVQHVTGVEIEDFIWDETPYICNFKNELKEILCYYRSEGSHRKNLALEKSVYSF